jgi:hypothetical protein
MALKSVMLRPSHFSLYLYSKTIVLIFNNKNVFDFVINVLYKAMAIFLSLVVWLAGKFLGH